MQSPTNVMWPALLAQDTPPASSAPVDTSPPPASSTGAADGDGGTQAPGDPNATGGQGTGTSQGPGGLGGMMLPLILVFVVLMIFTMGSGRKEKKRRAQMLTSLQKNAKVQTVGGVLGTVVEVRDDEVVVKVDENSNTRMRFAKSAINSVLSDD